MRDDFYIWTERDGSDAVEVDRDKDEAVEMLAGNVERNWLIQEVARMTDGEVWKKSDAELIRIYAEYRSLMELVIDYDDIPIEYGWEDKLDDVRSEARRRESHYDSWNDRWIEEHWGR